MTGSRVLPAAGTVPAASSSRARCLHPVAVSFSGQDFVLQPGTDSFVTLRHYCIEWCNGISTIPIGQTNWRSAVMLEHVARCP
jgi:hypothetical protein